MGVSAVAGVKAVPIVAPSEWLYYCLHLEVAEMRAWVVGAAGPALVAGASGPIPRVPLLCSWVCSEEVVYAVDEVVLLGTLLEHASNFLDAGRVALLRDVLQVVDYVPSLLLTLLQPLEELTLPLHDTAIPVGRPFFRGKLAVVVGFIVDVGVGIGVELWADRSSHISALLIFGSFLSHESVDVFLEL